MHCNPRGCSECISNHVEEKHKWGNLLKTDLSYTSLKLKYVEARCNKFNNNIFLASVRLSVCQKLKYGIDFSFIFWSKLKQICKVPELTHLPAKPRPHKKKM